MANLTVHPACIQKFAFAETCFAPSVLPYFEFWLHHAESVELRGFALLQNILKFNGTKILRTRDPTIGPKDSPKGRMNVSNIYFNLNQTLKLNRIDKQMTSNKGISLMPCSRVLNYKALQLVNSWMALENPEDSVYAVIECLRGIYSSVRIHTDLPDHKNRRHFNKFNYSLSPDPPTHRAKSSHDKPTNRQLEITTDKRYSTGKKMMFLKGSANLTQWISNANTHGKSNYQEQYITRGIPGARPVTHFGQRTSAAMTVCPDTLRINKTFFKVLTKTD